MKFGDAVLYQEGGKKYTALVLGARELQDHVGKAGEPLLNLVFAKEVLDMQKRPQDLSGTGSWGKLMQLRIDVAHISHKYSDEAKVKYGNEYMGGRWSVIGAAPAVAAKPAATPEPVGGVISQGSPAV
jgi:hypothetical protein